MNNEPIRTKKEFDWIMTGVQLGLVTFRQTEHGVEFDKGKGTIYYVDMVNYYNWYDKKRNGPDIITWRV